MQRLALALVLFAQMPSTFGEGIYKVGVDPRRPNEMKASLMLPARTGQSRKLALRGAAWGLESQVHDLRCEGTGLSPDGNGMWTLPDACSDVSWTIVPTQVADGTIDASKQSSLYFRQGWWLLSEPTSLPRLQGDETPSSVGIDKRASIGAMALSDGVWRLAPWNNAPEFLVLGNATPRLANIGGFHVVHVADAPDRVERLGLFKAHEAALRYLSTVVPTATLSPKERTLLVIWIGIDERHGHAGGAAGSRSFVANYVFGAPKSERLNAARTLLVLAHEQFHQLADLVRGPLPALPVWINESLAQYYGLKALVASSSEAGSNYSRFVDPARPVHDELIELERRNAAGDRAAYRLFYEHGATFWAEVDSALRAAPGNRGGLDPLIPGLLRSAPAESGGLPSAFMDTLRQALGARADELVGKYVGH